MRIIMLIVALALFPTATLAAKKQVCRDAKSGQFVTAAYAKKYPGLTTCEVKTDVVKQKKQG
jgi:hypothetical protein